MILKNNILSSNRETEIGILYCIGYFVISRSVTVAESVRVGIRVDPPRSQTLIHFFRLTNPTLLFLFASSLPISIAPPDSFDLQAGYGLRTLRQ